MARLRRPATICRCCRRSPALRSRMPSPRAARRSGSSSTPRRRWEVAEGLVKRAQAAGAPAIAVTLDVRSRGQMGDLRPAAPHRHRECGSCHGSQRLSVAASPTLTGIDLAGISFDGGHKSDLGLRQAVARHGQGQDAAQGHPHRRRCKMAADAGVDGIVVSNHGGRVEDGVPRHASTRCRKSSPRSAAGCRCWWTAASATAAISSRRWPGRQAVCIGRPYLWGLGAFGQPGVERVLGILRYETRACHATARRAINKGHHA